MKKKYEIFFLFIINIKLFIYQYSVSGFFLSTLIHMIPVFLSTFMLFSFSLLIKRKSRDRLLYFFNIIITIFIAADLLYFRYYKDVLSIPVIMNAFLLKDVKSSVTSLISPFDLIFFVDFFIKPSYFYKKDNSNELPISKRALCFVSIFILSVLLNSIIIKRLDKLQPRLIPTMYSKIAVTRYLGLLNYHSLDVFNYVSSEIDKNKPLSSEKKIKINNYFNNKPMVSNNYTGKYEGKNLIMIQVEALQGFVINTKINGREVTPNLNKFLKSSAYFNNCFYQVSGGNTSDAEFVVNNSLYPASEGAVAYKYYNNTLKSLPNTLKVIGYESYAMHGYKEDFWNRRVMNSSEGFNKFYGENSYTAEDKVGMGISDRAFFNQSLKIMSTFKEPYYDFMVTLSSHYPFEDPAFKSFDTGKFEGTLLGNYLESIHYFDTALGEFLNSLEKEGKLQDSIVVIYGDHYAVPRSESVDLSKLLNKDINDLSFNLLQKVPLIIHLPDGDLKGEYNKYCGQMDIFPTLGNLMGLSSKYTFGNDLFNKEESVILRNGSFIDGKVFYNSSNDKYYNLKTGKEVKVTKELKAEKYKALNNLEYSDDILNHDLLKELK